MHALIARAGEEPFPDEIISRLSVAVDDSMVDVRPDGLIYVSHPHYRNRLDDAFGVGGWCLVPLAAPRVQDNRVMYYGFLKARGQYIADAVGGAQYYPQNRAGSYDNAVEAAKSDCLVRCCKALPMFRECWDKDYASYWLATYAEGSGVPGSAGANYRKKAQYKRKEFKPLARVLGPDRPLRQISNKEYNDNAAYYQAESERERQAVESEQNQGQYFADDGRED